LCQLLQMLLGVHCTLCRGLWRMDVPPTSWGAPQDGHVTATVIGFPAVSTGRTLRNLVSSLLSKTEKGGYQATQSCRENHKRKDGHAWIEIMAEAGTQWVICKLACCTFLSHHSAIHLQRLPLLASQGPCCSCFRSVCRAFAVKSGEQHRKILSRSITALLSGGACRSLSHSKQDFFEEIS
jgi:hypothetical protein